MNFILAQVIGVVVTIYAVVATQFRSIKALLIAEIITNLLTALNYILLGSLSGTWICVVAAVQAVVMNHINRRSSIVQDKVRQVILLVFAATYIAGSILVFEKWTDIFPCVCALIYTLMVFQKDILRYKVVAIWNPFVWILYDVVTGAYTTVIMRVFLIVLTGITIVRIVYERKEGKDGN